MGLSWQQGPLSLGAIGRFLVPEPLPKRLLYAEPLRRRMRVRFGENWIADSEHVLLLFEPGRYPIAYFPETDISPDALQRIDYTTRHPELGLTSWYAVRAGNKNTARAAWQHTELPDYARELHGRVAFVWHSMDAFYEEDERIMGHAADSYHRIDIRQTFRHLVVRHRDRIIANTKRPLVLYESGFAPRWYVPRADVDESALTPVELQTFCPYKGLCSYYSIGNAPRGHGRIVMPIPRSVASPTWCHSSRTSSRYISMVSSSILSRVRRYFRTAPIETSPPPEVIRPANGRERARRARTDTGPDIPLDQQDRIFEQFHQLESSNTKAKSGTGLGFAIAKQIVEMHGDRIWVVSTLGKGSTFQIELPTRAEFRKSGP